MRCFALIVLSSLLVMAPALAQSRPQAVVLNPTQDLGVVNKGEQVTTEFVIENRGGEALRLFEIKSSCGCTVVEFDDEIGPGEEGRAKVTIDTTPLKGPVASQLLVYTSDPANPRLALTVKSEVRTLIATEPGYARYVVVEGFSERIVQAQTLWSPDGVDFEVERVRSPYPFLAATFREAKGGERLSEVPGRQWRVETALLPEAPVGPLSGYLKVWVTHPQHKVVTIPIFGLVQPVAEVTPAAADFGTVPDEESPSQSFVIRAATGLAIERVETELEGVEVNLAPLKQSSLWGLRLTLGADRPRGAIEGEVEIHTSSASRPVVILPVRARSL